MLRCFVRFLPLGEEKGGENHPIVATRAGTRTRARIDSRSGCLILHVYPFRFCFGEEEK